MPVDRFCSDKGNLVIDRATNTVMTVDPPTSRYRGILHTSHFSTCSDANQHRRTGDP